MKLETSTDKRSLSVILKSPKCSSFPATDGEVEREPNLFVIGSERYPRAGLTKEGLKFIFRSRLYRFGRTVYRNKKVSLRMNTRADAGGGTALGYWHVRIINDH